MRIGFFTDIHGNRDAFDAVLGHAGSMRLDRTVVLGDLVGYGADPVAVVDTVRRMAEAGASVIKGNHDAYAVRPGKGMTENARHAIEWTHRVLDADARAWLDALPYTIEEDDRLYVHASANEPEAWHYVDTRSAAAASLKATGARLIFCGHTHVPAVFHMIGGRGVEYFQPLPNKPTPVSGARRYLTVVGSVGQPRDRNPAACWALYDTDEKTITQHRVPYDPGPTMRRIKDAGLPEWLADRLLEGR